MRTPKISEAVVFRANVPLEADNVGAGAAPAGPAFEPAP
jgi:hypothetical protein